LFVPSSHISHPAAIGVTCPEDLFEMHVSDVAALEANSKTSADRTADYRNILSGQHRSRINKGSKLRIERTVDICIGPQQVLSSSTSEASMPSNTAQLLEIESDNCRGKVGTAGSRWSVSAIDTIGCTANSSASHSHLTHSRAAPNSLSHGPSPRQTIIVRCKALRGSIR
jgi:hypothetical protein